MAVDWRLAGQGFDAGDVLQSFGRAQDQQLQAQRQQAIIADRQRQQQLAQQAGVFAANGDARGGRQFALENGAWELAGHFDKMEEGERKRQMDQFSMLGQQALLADTPEKWDAAVQYYVQQGHPEAAGYVGQFGMRDQIIAQAGLAKEYTTNRLTQTRIADVGADNARADRTADNSIRATNTRLGFAANADRRGAAASARSAEARGEGRVRFRERDKDRAAIAAGGRGVRTDLSDLDY